MSKVLQKICLGLSQTLQNHGRRAPKSNREASRTIFLVAFALKSILVEVQNQCKAPSQDRPKDTTNRNLRPSGGPTCSNMVPTWRPKPSQREPKAHQNRCRRAFSDDVAKKHYFSTKLCNKWNNVALILNFNNSRL